MLKNLHQASLPFSAIPFAPLDFCPGEYLRKLLSPWCLIKTSKQCAVQERLRPLIVLSTKARNSRKRITCSLVPGQGIAGGLGKKGIIDVSIIGRNFVAFHPWVNRFFIVTFDFLISMRQLNTFHPVTLLMHYSFTAMCIAKYRSRWIKSLLPVSRIKNCRCHKVVLVGFVAFEIPLSTFSRSA